MRTYIALAEGITFSAARCFLQVNAASDGALVVMRYWVEQEVTEVSEQLGLQLLRVTTAGTATSTTPAPVRVGDPAFGGTASHTHTVDPTLSTVLHRRGFNVLNGIEVVLPPEQYIYVPASGRIALRLPTAPSGSLTLTGGIMFGEID
jgi:hypothetical protein